MSNTGWNHLVGLSGTIFIFLLFFHQWNTDLRTGADRFSSKRLVKTPGPCDSVWGRLRRNDRWPRKFSLKTCRASSHVCKSRCITSGANIEFKWLSCFDSLIIQMKGLAEKKDCVPNALLWVILFLHFLPVSHLWIILVWKPVIIESHVTKSL